MRHSRVSASAFASNTVSVGDVGWRHCLRNPPLREAFRWSVMRRVTSTASVSLAGNRYTVDAALLAGACGAIRPERTA